VKFLIEQGANLELLQHIQSAALHVVSFYGHIDIVRYLLESEADYRIVNSYDHIAEEEAILIRKFQ
jgi:ankyrin repeat protein